MPELIVLAAIGNPEAKTYGMSFAYMGMLLIAIALGFLIIMIGLRGQAQGERSPYMRRTNSSSWIATRIFLVGWGIAVLSAFFIVTIFPRVISYYIWLNEFGYGFHWCYECSGWQWTLGPELSIVVSGISLAAFAIGIIMVATKGRERINCKSW
ncbi:MAG: hypothetical protein ACREBU_06090 [Nitrososphaera sp.]